MEQLKPCPFCGRTDKLIIHEVIHRLDDTDIKQYTIEGRNIIGKPGARRPTGGNRGIYHAKEEGRK